MSKGIKVNVLGDFGPFSRMGKSISYRITIGKSDYLVDCGAPLFQQIGGHGLKEINGLLITHAHDDHKRWFSDLALFNMYAMDIDHKVFFLTSEDIHDDIMSASGAALDRSLTHDSKKVIDISYEDYVDYRKIGPAAKYRITSVDEGNGCTSLCITDSAGKTVGPETAKIVISSKTKKPRMLFKDPVSGEWIEPESYYPFSSDVFYETDKNIYKDSEGFTIEAVKAPVWHGISAIGIKFRTNEETLIFSSDTVNNIPLWKELYTEKRPQKLNMSREDFENVSVINGDINDYIERVWSEDRYKEAVTAFDDAIVIHDISIRAGAVHTDYRTLKDSTIKKDMSILTHGPDKITSEWVLCDTDKNFIIKGGKFFEEVGGRPYPMNADIFNKQDGQYFVGYRNEKGAYTVYEKDGLLNVSIKEDPGLGKPLYKVDMYEDISGEYFPRIEGGDAFYFKRKDGQVELVEITEAGSRGKVVENQRDKLAKE